MKTVIDPTAFLAPGCVVLGDVTLGARCNVWYGAVIRGDMDRVTIGDSTNIQDGAVLHEDPGFPLTIGRDVTVGHNATVHGCTIGDNTVIGMGAVVLDGAVIGRDCIIGAGSLVPQNMEIPDGSIAFGSPCKVRRSMSEEDIAENKKNAEEYLTLAELHRHL